MNFASAVVLIVIVAVLFVAVRYLLKQGSGCAACGHDAKGGCGACSGCRGCNAGKDSCAFHYDPEKK